MANSPYMGEIRTFGFNYAPQGYAMCNGQILNVSQYTALYSLLGITYGGNGQTTFQLPNLQGRVPVHFGQGLGLSPYVMGQNGGSENVTLTGQQMPQHIHAFSGSLNASDAKATAQDPSAGAYLARSVDDQGTDTPLIYIPAGTAPGPTFALAGVSGNTAVAGGSQGHPNVQPYLALNFCIALQGLYPTRS